MSPWPSPFRSLALVRRGPGRRRQPSLSRHPHLNKHLQTSLVENRIDIRYLVSKACLFVSFTTMFAALRPAVARQTAAASRMVAQRRGYAEAVDGALKLSLVVPHQVRPGKSMRKMLRRWSKGKRSIPGATGSIAAWEIAAGRDSC